MKKNSSFNFVGVNFAQVAIKNIDGDDNFTIYSKIGGSTIS
jgi:hypothetical protein